MFRSLLLVALCVPLLAACGFHLRRSAQLAPQLQHLYLQVSGGGSLLRQLAGTLRASGVHLADAEGPGVAVLNVPVNAFSTQALTLTGFARVSEYAVHYQVQFQVLDANGKTLIPLQSIHMSRDFTFDQTQVLGSAGQQEQIQRGLVDDMAQAILMRLQAQGAHIGQPDLQVPAPGRD